MPVTELGRAPQLLLDSPTLARVERARLRQEGVPAPARNSCCQASPVLQPLSVSPGCQVHALKRGLLWQQRDRLFSRWKERYFILTRDYLHCFKRASTADRISDMGQFIFKLKLVDVERVEWINRKSYSTVAVELPREDRLLLRAADGLEDWFELLEECTQASKERRKALRNSHDPSLNRSGTKASVNSSFEDWVIARNKIARLHHLSDSVPDLAQTTQNHKYYDLRKKRDEHDKNDDQWHISKPYSHEHRLSLLTDIDINSCDIQLDTPPTLNSTHKGRPSSYRLNNDVFFMSPGNEQTEHLQSNGGAATPAICVSRSQVTPIGSVRSAHMFTPANHMSERYPNYPDNPHMLKYRDRSQSDVHKYERFHWKGRPEDSRRASFLVHATQV